MILIGRLGAVIGSAVNEYSPEKCGKRIRPNLLSKPSFIVMSGEKMRLCGEHTRD